MKHWLMKSEPAVYPWAQLLQDKTTGWTGVRNFQARNNMQAMKKGDRAFFYHSNEGKEIVGIMEIVKEYHPDPTDKSGNFGMVSVAPAKALAKPVTLAQIKTHAKLKNMALIKQARLSVSPVTQEEWEIVCKLGA